MYLLKITNRVTGEVEMLVQEYPNQRDAQKYGVLDSIMVASGAAQPDDCDAEIVDTTTQESRISEWMEQYR